MDFFKSMFATDPDADIFPSDSPMKKKSMPDDEDERGGEAAVADCPNSNSPSTAGGVGAWGFGGLIKTIAAKKEFGSLIETYRRDLAEFGSGLKKETAAIHEATTRAVRDLPGSLEAGVFVAQESLESFGQAIDDLDSFVWQGTIEIISQGREAQKRKRRREVGGWELGLRLEGERATGRAERRNWEIRRIRVIPGSGCSQPEPGPIINRSGLNPDISGSG